jgi:hypothetical protein
LLQGETDQVVTTTIENIGSTTATYKVKVEGPGTGVSTVEQIVTIPGGMTQSVVVPVEAEAMTIGTFELTATLTTTTDDVLASTKASVSVADVSGLTPQQIIDLKNQIAEALIVKPDVVTVEPARLLDTRSNGETVDGQFAAAGKLGAGQFTRVKIAGRAGVAADAVGVELNITAIQNEGRGFATLYPCTSTPPTASSLNYTPGVNIANATTVVLNSNGEVCIFTSSTAHYALDVLAYISA